MLVGTVEVTLLILLAVILAGPLVAERFRIPGLLGLIFFGMVFGPHVLDWLGRVGLVDDLGSIGILYLMFLAGLSFNLKAFVANRRSAITFGLLGFGVPFLLSLWVGVSYLETEVLAAALIGAMWASNTLVAYPDVRAAGLGDNRAVRDAVSAGVVADLLSLLVLAVATSHAVLDISTATGLDQVNPQETPSLPLVVGIPLLVFFTIWVLPRVGGWFFVKVGHSRVQRFLFALVGMAAGASVATLAGVEGLIGAFLAGLGLNPLVPSGSELMDRLDFVGSTLFVPAFLVSIGLKIDPVAFFDLETLQLGLVFTGLVVVGKTIAVAIGGAAFRLSLDEIGLMSALSYGQAASTLAIAQVGLQLGLFDQAVVNGAVVAIVLTALLTSYGTQLFIRRVPRPAPPPAAVGERVLVDSRPSSSNLGIVMQFAGAIAASDAGVVIPFVIPRTGDIDYARRRVDEAAAAAAQAGHDVEGIARISDSFATGALELTKETDATLSVIPWEGLSFTREYLFGMEVDAFGERSPIPTVAVRLVEPWDRVVVLVGDTRVAWHREDARLAFQIGVRLLPTKESEMLLLSRRPEDLEEPLEDYEGLELLERDFKLRDLLRVIRPNDLIILPAYVLQSASATSQIRLARRFVRTDVAVVAGPNRLTLSRVDAQRRMERILGPSS